MAVIKTLTSGTGEVLYPKTLVRAVYADDGTNLGDLLEEANNTKSKMLTNVSIPTSIWVTNSGDATYPYKAVISDSFVTADTFVQVVFNDTQRQEVCFGNPISSSGAITLPCMWKYTSNFIIPTIFLHNIN